MFSKKAYCLLLLLFVVEFYAQSIPIPSSKISTRNIASILLQEKHFGKDTLALKKYLKPLSGSPTHDVIYEGLLANGYKISYDQINKKSNFHYLQSIAKATQLKHLPLQIWTRLNYVDYLYHFMDYNTMTPILLEAISKIKKINPDEMILPGESFKKIGWIMQTIGDNQEALSYFKLAQTYTSQNTSEYAALLDAIGISHLNTNNLDKASSYFNQTAQLARKTKDKLRYAKALGNLALVYQKKGYFEKAISLVEEDIRISEKLQSHRNTMFASILLSQLHLKNNELQAAETVLKKAESIARSKSYYKTYELKIIQLKLNLLQRQNKTNNELELRRRMSLLEDSIKTRSGILAINNLNWVLEKTKFQQKIDKANAQYEQESILKNTYAIIVLLLILLAFLIYLNLKKQLKNKQLEYKQKTISMELEKLKIEQELTTAHSNLNAQIDYLKNKNIQIKKLKVEIEHLKQSTSENSEKEKLTALLESHLMTENNWIQFKREFQKEHQEFYQMLHNEFPELTDSNIRILLLQKLDFSNTEIAELLGITTDAIKKSKQRLKKKLGAKYELLFEYIKTKTS